MATLIKRSNFINIIWIVYVYIWLTYITKVWKGIISVLKLRRICKWLLWAFRSFYLIFVGLYCFFLIHSLKGDVNFNIFCKLGKQMNKKHISFLAGVGWVLMTSKIYGLVMNKRGGIYRDFFKKNGPRDHDVKNEDAGGGEWILEHIWLN